MIKGESNTEKWQTNKINPQRRAATDSNLRGAEGGWREGRMTEQRSRSDLQKLQGKVPWARIQKPVVSYTGVMSKALGSMAATLYTHTHRNLPIESKWECVRLRENLHFQSVCEASGLLLLKPSTENQGFQWQRLGSQGNEVREHVGDLPSSYLSPHRGCGWC